MVIDVNKLCAKGEFEGRFSCDYDAPTETIMVPLFSFDGPVKVEVEYTICEDDSVEVRIKVRFALTGSCSYCLEPARADIEYEYEARLVPYESDDDYPYDGKMADITPAVNDAILFSQPQVILCKDGCKGIDVK